jgi:predicted nucleotidyltransferase
MTHGPGLRQPTPPSPEQAERIIAAMADRIVERFHPLRVVLFGSRATGLADPWSDVDLLVVVEQAPNRRALTAQIYRELASFGLPKDVLVATPGILEEQAGLPGSLLRAALREGRTLYARG